MNETPSNSVAARLPHIARQWHPTKNGFRTPDNTIAGTHSRLWLTCETCGYDDWNATGASLLSGTGCPRCAGKVVGEVNSLATARPDVVEQWNAERNSVQPQEVAAGSQRKVWLVCETCGYDEWSVRPEKLAAGQGCPACAGKVPHGPNTVAAKLPHIARQWHPTGNGDRTPEDTVAGTNKKIQLICDTCGYDAWAATGVSLLSGTGCPACAGRMPHGPNTVAAKLPSVARQWHPTKNGERTPDDTVAGTSMRIWLLCETCGHEWSMAGNNLSRGRGRCPGCSTKIETEPAA